MERQVRYLKKKGILLGPRLKNGRKIYIYMLRNLFVEVLFKNDDMEEAPEQVNLVSGIDNLNKYLEDEFRSSF